jgi:hypothetical protein
MKYDFHLLTLHSGGRRGWPAAAEGGSVRPLVAGRQAEAARGDADAGWPDGGVPRGGASMGGGGWGRHQVGRPSVGCPRWCTAALSREVTPQWAEAAGADVEWDGPTWGILNGDSSWPAVSNGERRHWVATAQGRRRGFRVKHFSTRGCDRGAQGRGEGIGCWYKIWKKMSVPLYIRPLTKHSSVSVPRNIAPLYSSVPGNRKSPRHVPYFPVVGPAIKSLDIAEIGGIIYNS